MCNLEFLRKYIIAAVFEKQPFRKISEIKLSLEAAIRMHFSTSLFDTYREILCNRVRFLVNLHLTLCNFEPLLRKFNYFITTLINAEQLLL